TSNNGVEIVFNDTGSLNASNLKTATETIIVIDGFLSNLTTPMSQTIKNAYVDNMGDKVNVIVLDYGRLSGSGQDLSNPLNTATSYLTVISNVEPIGQRVADFLDFLRANKQIQFSDVTVIGHSLGAHVAGDVGRAHTRPYCWSGSGSDAIFVDIYHTNRGVLGIIDDIGHVNVYVNSGTVQPGCAIQDIVGTKGYCSHSYSWKFFTSAFQNNYTACPCLFIFCICANCNANCNNGIPVGPAIPTNIFSTVLNMESISNVVFLASLSLALAFSLVHADISTNVDDLRYYYFPTTNNGVEIVFNDTGSLNASNLKAATQTIIVIDGFLSNLTTPMSQTVKNAYVENMGDQVNVIVLDYGRLSGSGQDLSNPVNTASSYQIVMSNVQPIGQRVADFLDFLRANKQIQFSDVTIICHSLGAHVSGDVGKAVKNTYNSILARIAGLDPAGPLYSLQLIPSLRLDKNDASFVDVYHTNRGVLGIVDDIGQVNVYVNSGSVQPGCAIQDVVGTKGYCSHSFSWKFFTSAFQTNYTACPCLLVTCICANCYSNCNNGIPVGPAIPTNSSGLYSVSSGALP
ncbi:putative endothelial lipase, partial [Orchesella cincta]